jgi:signal transduction histidine kinase
VSHELRTPLNSVIGFTNILIKRKRNELNPEDLLFLERILENGKHLLAIIDDVLDLSKIEAGHHELNITSISLKALIRETIAQLEGRILGKDLAIYAEMPDQIAPFQTDAGKLKQILINLIGNAIKFTERGTIRVRLEVENTTHKAVRIDVIDSGIGIPPDRQAAIFEPFKQADSSTTRRFGGTGLGLTISQTFSELLGYRLELRSEVGKGSTFSIILNSNDSFSNR